MTRPMGLTARIFAVFVLFAIALLVGLGALANRSGRESLQAAAMAELLSTAIVREGRIREWISDQAIGAETLAASPSLRNGAGVLVRSARGSAGAAAAYADIAAELEARRLVRPSQYLMLAVIDARDGRILVATERRAEGQQSGAFPYFAEGRTRTHVQPPFNSPLLRVPAIAVGTPVRDPAGRTVAVVATWLSLDEFDRIARGHSALRRTDDAYMVGADAHFVTRPRLVDRDVVLREKVQTESVRRCLAGERGVAIAPDYRRQQAVIVYRWIAEHQLCLVAKQDLAEVLEPAYAFRRQLALFGGVVLLIAAALALGLARTIVRPVSMLHEGVARFSSGEREVALPVIGRDVLARLAAEFNGMADTIRQREAELSRQNERLEQTVASRTAELAASEAQFRLLLDSTAEAIYGVDPQGLCTFVNRACVTMLGYGSADDLVGRDMARILGSGGSQGSPRSPLDVHALELPGHLDEVKLRRADGSMLTAQFSSHPMHRNHERIGTVATFLDISERMRAQKELDRFFELSLDMLAIAGFDGVFRRLNPAWGRILGYDVHELTSRPFVEFVHPDDVENTLYESSKLAAGDATVSFENRYLAKDGSYRWLLWQAAPSLDDGLIYAAAADITRIKEAAMELRVAKEAAEAGSRAKSDFLANMSHEIRTPLNGVLGTVGLLMNTPLNRQQRELAHLATASGETLLTIINDILDFAKIEAGKLELECRPFDLLQTVEEVSGMTGLQAADKQLDLVVRYPVEVPRHLVGDAGRIRQVLVNLVNNAIKFTERGHVLVDVAVDALDEREASVHIRVEDTGIGIADDARARLFEKFSQADVSTTRRFGGTGLGLAISSQLVALMGGQIGVESVPGEGSTFWLRIPLSLQHGVRDDPAPVDLRGTRVLIVDDNSVNRRVLHEQILQWGMRSGSCANAKDALRKLREAVAEGDAYPIAILDYQMPDIDGEMLGRAIKADPVLAGTSLIMLTSLGNFDDNSNLRDIGFAAYLSKPVRQSDLLNALSMVKGGRGAPTGAQARVDDADARSAAGAHVLLVEDNATNRYVATLMLKDLGCTVEVAGDGREALDRLDRVAYDLVFMDCEMPVMDGFEATAMIRGRTDDRASVPIIAVTAQAMQGDREHCLAAGMDDYLTKPVHMDDFRRVLRRWMPVSRARPAADTPTVAAPPSPDRANALDANVVAQLRALAEASDPALLMEIFHAFRADTVLRMASLREAAATADATLLRRTAHTIKGASGNVGATSMALVAGDLELLARGGTVTGADTLIDLLQAEFERVLPEIDGLGSGKKTQE